jgi:hypothetical protein
MASKATDRRFMGHIPMAGMLRRGTGGGQRPARDTLTLAVIALIGLAAVPTLAQAECGWLLMVPPDMPVPGSTPAPDAWKAWFEGYEKQTEANIRAPLSHGTQWKAFDSARECEAESDREKDLHLAVLRADVEQKGPPGSEAETARQLRAEINMGRAKRWNSARCLPASQVPVR